MEMENLGQVTWADMKEGENSESMESSSMNDSEPSSSSSSSSSSSLLADDASSSSSSSLLLADDASSSSSTSSSSSRGPLYEFDDLMAQLPIKRGLSKFYDGKSESFGSLLSVRSVEDLAKKEILYSKRMKWCKSYGSNLNRHKHSPKATIAKKSPKGTLTFSPKGTMAIVN